jgi:hypothetical protein
MTAGKEVEEAPVAFEGTDLSLAVNDNFEQHLKFVQL